MPVRRRRASSSSGTRRMRPLITVILQLRRGVDKDAWRLFLVQFVINAPDGADAASRNKRAVAVSGMRHRHEGRIESDARSPRTPQTQSEPSGVIAHGALARSEERR